MRTTPADLETALQVVHLLLTDPVVEPVALSRWRESTRRRIACTSATLWLTIASMVWAVLFGMTIGIVSAVWRNKWPDRLGMTLAVSGISFPAFALGMLLMEIFSVKLGWLPIVGDGTWQSYILPSITLGAAVAAVMARFTRSSFTLGMVIPAIRDPVGQESTGLPRAAIPP